MTMVSCTVDVQEQEIFKKTKLSSSTYKLEKRS